MVDRIFQRHIFFSRLSHTRLHRSFAHLLMKSRDRAKHKTAKNGNDLSARLKYAHSSAP